MLPNRHSPATQTCLANAGMHPIAPASKHVTTKLLLAALVLNAAIVLVGLPRVAGVLEYNLRLGDLYDLIGKNLDQGYGYRVDPNMGETILREPLYPFLIAAVFKLAGYGDQGPRLACILLVVASALMLMRLARKITQDNTVSTIAALLFVLYPGTLAAEARAGIEPASVLTVLVFMLVLYRGMESGTLWLYLIAGLLPGIAVLVRSEVLLFPVILLTYFVFTSNTWLERWRAGLRMLVLAAGAFVAMSPWLVRNYLLVHEFVPTTTLAGVAAQEGLYTCQYLYQYGSFVLAQRGAGRERAEIARQLGLPFEGSYYYQFFYTPQNEVRFNRSLLYYVSKEYRRNPRILASCAAKNLFFNFWFLGRNPKATQINILIQLPLLLFALGGLIVLHKRGGLRNAAIIILYTFYVTIIHASIIAHARHSMLVTCFLAIPAAVFLAWGWHRATSPASADVAERSCTIGKDVEQPH